MPKQESLIKIIGTIDGITYYKSKGQYLLRKKGMLSKERIASDPVFQRSRENSSEFGRAARSGKLFRNAFAQLIKDANDYQLTARVAKIMTKLKDLDQTSDRGNRCVHAGIKEEKGKSLLKGFNFNQNAQLQSILHKQCEVDASTGQIDISGLIPTKDLLYPKGATHVSFGSAMTWIDFEQHHFTTSYSSQINIPINQHQHEVQIGLEHMPDGASGVRVMVLQILFYQEINGIQYLLNNLNYSCMEVLSVE